MASDVELALVPDPDFAMRLGGEPVPGEGLMLVDRSSGSAIRGGKSLKKWGLACVSIRLEPPFQSRTDPRFEPGERVSLPPERSDHLPAMFGVWDDKGGMRIGSTDSDPRSVALAMRGQPAAGVILGVSTPRRRSRTRGGMVILIGPSRLLDRLVRLSVDDCVETDE